MKLMLVDDEPIVRDGIKLSIPWETVGITIVAEAGDGKSALSKAIKYRPDIILCDIRMPILDGISFVKTLKELLPDVRTIMLTAYAEKEYMLEAIRCGVSDFLLKPAGLDQIYQTVLKVRNEIREERNARLLLLQRDELLEENAILFREHYVSALLEGQQPIDKIKEAIRLLHLPIVGPRYAVLLARPVPGHEWLLLQALSRVFEPFQPIMAQMCDKKYVGLIINLKANDTPEIVRKMMDQRGVEASNALIGALVLTDIADDLCYLSAAYQAAKEIAPRCVWFEKGCVLRVSEARFEPVNSAIVQDLQSRLITAFGNCSNDELRMVAAETFDRLIGMRPPYEMFLGCLDALCQKLSAGHSAQLAMPEMLGLSPYDAGALFIEAVLAYKAQSRTLGGGHVGRALRYIEQHYAEELSLERVAKVLYLSPTYLSRMLNENTERGFIGWLRYFRIQKAKELLANTEMKNYEIAEAVGYNTYKVFSEHFLDETGETVSSWRNR